jgi:glycosyltransferase involved in cell wall biosynthesis
VDWAALRNDIAPFFDAEFYFEHNPDVERAGIDPVLHYVQEGWKEGRDPTPDFSTRFYLDTHRDVADARINPFWHFVVAGQKEGRAINHPGGEIILRLAQSAAFEDEARKWRNGKEPAEVLSEASLGGALEAAARGGPAGLILSFGHDDYRAISGGVQLSIQREVAAYLRSGWRYLNVHPWQPLPSLVPLAEARDPYLCVVLDGATLGVCRATVLEAALKRCASGFLQRRCVIHSFLGHAPERLSDLLRAADLRDCHVWLHDYLSLCVNYTLLRNGIGFCGAPPPESNACGVCRFGGARRVHTVRMWQFFEAHCVHMLSPSQVALDVWRRSAKLPVQSTRVVPHAELSWTRRPAPLDISRGPISIGYAGTRAPHKGWPVFARLARQLSSDAGFRFYFFGDGELRRRDMTHVRVKVSAQDPMAMADAIRNHQVDLVLHWANWPETFSFSTFEAIAGSAYVLTNRDSGNVAATILNTGRGVVLEDEADLIAFLADGRASAMVEAVRRERAESMVEYRMGDITYTALEAR